MDWLMLLLFSWSSGSILDMRVIFDPNSQMKAMILMPSMDCWIDWSTLYNTVPSHFIDPSYGSPDHLHITSIFHYSFLLNSQRLQVRTLPRLRFDFPDDRWQILDIILGFCLLVLGEKLVSERALQLISQLSTNGILRTLGPTWKARRRR